ncbi:CTP synthetase [Halobacteriales archaeon QS_1_67_19]|nr:MAG: CTP synthetase [Halobacteriales archaeon QS_1_67_19]
MRAIVVGPNGAELTDALEAEGVEITRVEGLGTRPALEDAGVVEADTVVLTDAEAATAIPIAKDLNEDLRAVVYTAGDLPDFARGQADLIVDPQLLSADAVAEELAAE